LNKLLISYQDIISPENLLLAWQEFCRGKRKAKDVQQFERNLADNLLALHEELANGTYQHGGYCRFCINDPKPRIIHKACVRDRLVHHAIHRLLYPNFDCRFISDSYSCRKNKGTHRAMAQFKQYAHRLSQNNTRTVWVLKCDIRKFFDSIDHGILLELLRQHITDERLSALLENVINSFSVPATMTSHSSGRIGLPLGNLTSQLFVNIYMNTFDQWAKHALKAKYYIRYADDFVLLSANRRELENAINPIATFLHERLRLNLHPDKLFIKTYASGVDFLGWIHFPGYRVLRTAAKRRMLRTLKQKAEPAVLQSYQGLLKHGKAFHLQQQAMNQYWLYQ